MIDYKASHSEVEAFRACPRKHFYGYGLKIQAVNISTALARGIIGHAVLAEYYSGLKDGLTHAQSTARAFTLLGTRVNELGEFYNKDQLRIELFKVINDYFNWDQVQREAEENEILAVEKEVRIEVPDTGGFSLPFVVDLIWRVPGRGIEALDHKFVYNFFNANLVDLSPQLPLYYGGLRLLGYPALTCRYNELRYRDTKESDKDPTKRFNRPAPRINEKRIVTTVAEHIKTSRIIYALKNNMILEEWEDWVTRAGNKNCERCDFAKMCIGELNGESRSLFVGIDYIPRPRRD